MRYANFSNEISVHTTIDRDKRQLKAQDVTAKFVRLDIP